MQEEIEFNKFKYIHLNIIKILLKYYLNII